MNICCKHYICVGKFAIIVFLNNSDIYNCTEFIYIEIYCCKPGYITHMLISIYIYSYTNTENVSPCITLSTYSSWRSRILSRTFFVDKNECLSEPCENNGTCINSQGSYKCDCNNGWTGKDCIEGNIVL